MGEGQCLVWLLALKQLYYQKVSPKRFLLLLVVVCFLRTENL